MPTWSRWWRYIRNGFGLCRQGCPCRLWWFSVKQWPNCSTLCPPGNALRTFVQYLITYCSRKEAAGDVISTTFVGPVVLDKGLKFHDPNLNLSREIPPEAVGGGIFDCFPYNFWPKVDNHIISGVAVDNVGMNVCEKFGDSRSNGFSRYSRGWFRVERTNERTDRYEADPNNAKRFSGVSTKKVKIIEVIQNGKTMINHSIFV